MNTIPETAIQEERRARTKMRGIKPRMRADGPRMAGCKAFPSVDTDLPGAPYEWCRDNQGEWCGACRHRRM